MFFYKSQQKYWQWERARKHCYRCGDGSRGSLRGGTETVISSAPDEPGFRVLTSTALLSHRTERWVGLENKFAHREALYQVEKTQIFGKNSGIPAFNASRPEESRFPQQLQGHAPHDLLAENQEHRLQRTRQSCPQEGRFWR